MSLEARREVPRRDDRIGGADEQIYSKDLSVQDGAMRMMKAGVLFWLALAFCTILLAKAASEEADKADEKEWGKAVGGLRCRLYVEPYEPGKSRDRYELRYEVENVGNAPVALPVLNTSDPVPWIQLRIREEPKVSSLPSFEGSSPGLYVLTAGQSYRFPVSSAYFIGYGKRISGKWIRFKPKERPYHLAAIMECKRDSGEIQDVYIPANGNVFGYSIRGESEADKKWTRYERYWQKGTLSLRGMVRKEEEVRRPGLPPYKKVVYDFLPSAKKENVAVHISESSLRIEDEDLKELQGKNIPIWAGKLVSNTVEMRLH